MDLQRDRQKIRPPLVPSRNDSGVSVASTDTALSVLETADWPSLAPQPSVIVSDETASSRSTESTAASTKNNQSANTSSAVKTNGSVGRSSAASPSVFLGPLMPAPVKLLDEFGVFHEQSTQEVSNEFKN